MEIWTRARVFVLVAITLGAYGGLGLCDAEAAGLKQHSVFITKDLIERARANIAAHEWAASARDAMVARAKQWVQLSDDALWDLMFGATITRSWMVWSDGFCPSCRESVPMYTWQMDPFAMPWKVRCPHCEELFPKNDFGAFYRSGLDEHRVFDPARADRSLLLNAEHPDENDPLRAFGVDDGEGYLDGEHRWRFIGAYLVYSQWKAGILNGIDALSDAYMVTGDPLYAHKAGVLIDRVADLYPTFDFKAQAEVYEQPGAAGYISTWHDACEEVRELALGYDQVFEGMGDDPSLVEFLSRKAREAQLENQKTSFADIQRNIEERILADTVTNAWKIHSNYPRTDIALMTLKAVLAWPDSREEIHAMADPMLEQATSVDGVTGEKGLCGYSAYTVQGTTAFLAQFSRLEPDFLATMFERHPRLREMFRFHIDTHCLDEYYPLSGDCGAFAHKVEPYVGVSFSNQPTMTPSAYSLLMQVHDVTGDPAYVQVLYQANGRKTDGLPYDLFAEDPDAFEQRVADIIAREGDSPKLASTNKQEWCIAILRSGAGADARAVWLDYDAGGGHSHCDGMNLGLFAKGLDLMPDFGYPPVQFGGWSGPRFAWYLASMAHNTVVIDGANSVPGSGKTTLWGDGRSVRLIRASAPEIAGAQQFERTVVSVDTSDKSFYVLDVFRVVGGQSHVRTMHSHYASLTTEGLSLQPAGDALIPDTQMREFALDTAPAPGWSADWKVEDKLDHVPEGADVHTRLTDLTTGAEAIACEGWIAAGGFSTNEESWIPRVLTRRTSTQAPLASTFVGIIEPYEGAPSVASARRLKLTSPDGREFPDPSVAVEVKLVTGETDILIAADAENPLHLEPARSRGDDLVVAEYGIRLTGEFCLVRLGADGRVLATALAQAEALRIGDLEVTLPAAAPFVELAFADGAAAYVAGAPGNVPTVSRGGEPVTVRQGE